MSEVKQKIPVPILWTELLTPEEYYAGERDRRKKDVKLSNTLERRRRPGQEQILVEPAKTKSKQYGYLRQNGRRNAASRDKD